MIPKETLSKLVILSEKETGLPLFILVQKKPDTIPKVKIAKSVEDILNQNFITATISDNPKFNKDLKLEPILITAIKHWIRVNKVTLMKYWNKKLDLQGLLSLLYMYYVKEK